MLLNSVENWGNDRYKIIYTQEPAPQVATFTAPRGKSAICAFFVKVKYLRIAPRIQADRSVANS
jgi:hypothetical protein